MRNSYPRLRGTASTDLPNAEPIASTASEDGLGALSSKRRGPRRNGYECPEHNHGPCVPCGCAARDPSLRS